MLENGMNFIDLCIFLPLPWLEGDVAGKEKLLDALGTRRGSGWQGRAPCSHLGSLMLLNGSVTATMAPWLTGGNGWRGGGEGDPAPPPPTSQIKMLLCFPDSWKTALMPL